MVIPEATAAKTPEELIYSAIKYEMKGVIILSNISNPNSESWLRESLFLAEYNALVVNIPTIVPASTTQTNVLVAVKNEK